MARWVWARADAAEAAALARELGLRPAVARVLCVRGCRTPEAARAFLNPTPASLHDPYGLAGMEAAVARLHAAVERREPVLIYGDYDVDGTSAVAILQKAIEMAGGRVDWHVPHRLRDGYGMRPEAVERAAAEGIRLIVSVDTGIRAAVVVGRARELGIDVIVTDHHLPEAELPPALAVLNPNRPDCRYPGKDLCGAGVAFKLAEALLRRLDWPEEKRRRVMASFLKLVALATVADVAPLVGENRTLVKLGLEGLRDARNAGLRALLAMAGVPPGRAPSAGEVAWRVGPRLNAAGRMDTAEAVIEMLLTSDEKRARELAAYLDERNRERQQTEAEMVARCLEIAVAQTEAGLVFCGDGWHKGVVGIVASRLVDRYHRPVFVLSREGELAQGSGRSVPGFHLLEALESMPGLFARYGGHAHAAGVTMAARDVERFRERFNAYAAERLGPEDFVARVEIEAALALADIDARLLEDLDRLEPYGCGNPRPVFAALDVEVAAAAMVWKERHVRVSFRQGGRYLNAKGWGRAELATDLPAGARVDLAFTLERDEWGAAQEIAGWSATLADVRPAEPRPAYGTGVSAVVD